MLWWIHLADIDDLPLYGGQLGQMLDFQAVPIRLASLDGYEERLLVIVESGDQTLGRTLGIKFLDHIIFNHKGYCSFLESEEL